MTTWHRAFLEANYPSYVRAVRAAAQQPRWLCWRYTPAEWQFFDDTMWASNLSSLRKLVLWELLFFGLLALGSVAVVVQMGVGLFACLFFCVALAVGIVVALIFLRNAYRRLSDAHQRRQHDPPEICIGPLAVFLPGQAIALAGATLQPPTLHWDPLMLGMDVLQDVRLAGEIPRQVVRFLGRPIHPRAPGGLGRLLVVEVPVPHGREAEARQLVERFHTQILNGPE
jgi:hypothetical protein